MMTNYKCKYCGFKTSIKTIITDHIRNIHSIFDNRTTLDTLFEVTKPMSDYDEIEKFIPDPEVIDSSISGGGGDFGGGGASGDF